MKKTKLLLGLIAALVVLAGAAIAQTYPNVSTIGTNPSSKLFIARGIYTSGTTAPAAGVDVTPNSTKPVNIITRGSVIASATITLELKDGTVLYSSATAVGTAPSTITFAAPIYFEVVRTSVTTPQTGTNSVSVTVTQ